MNIRRNTRAGVLIGAAVIGSWCTSVFAEEGASSTAEPEGSSNFVNGWVGPAYRLVNQMSEIEKGSRTRYVMEFGRTSKNVAFDLSIGQGNSVTDLGGMLKVFETFRIPSPDSGLSVQAGWGLGTIYCGSNCATGTGTFVNYSEFVTSPFVRVQYDFGLGFALAADFAYELCPYRRYSRGDDQTDTTLRKRTVIGFTLAVTSAWVD
jgi:hypothetical protein